MIKVTGLNGLDLQWQRDMFEGCLTAEDAFLTPDLRRGRRTYRLVLVGTLVRWEVWRGSRHGALIDSGECETQREALGDLRGWIDSQRVVGSKKTLKHQRYMDSFAFDIAVLNGRGLYETVYESAPFENRADRDISHDEKLAAVRDKVSSG